MQPFALALMLSLATAPTANKKTQLKVEISPASAVFYVDGKKKGSGGKVVTLNVEPGRHVVKVVNKGDEHQETVAIKKGEVKLWKWAFEDDRMDKGSGEAGGESEGEAAPEGDSAE